MRRFLRRRSSRWLWAVAVGALVLVAAGAGSAAGPAPSPASTEWWLQAVGMAGLTPPGPGTPVLIIDRRPHLSHPAFPRRHGPVAPNRQTITNETDDIFH